jgi:hypothetical protein
MGDRKVEWSTSRAIPRRKLWFELALLAFAGLAVIVVYRAEVMPLSASPESPPPGISIAWAGQQLRGYTESNYISAESCDEPAEVVMDLYRTGVAPEPQYTQSLTPGEVAFAIVGDSRLEPTDVRIWASRPRQGVAYRLLYGNRSALPEPLSFRAQVRSNAATGERESMAFVFRWNPAERPDIAVAFKADWIYPRVRGVSCWLTIPGQLSEGPDASTAANDAIGHPGWNESDLGLPLFNAGTEVNAAGGDKMALDTAATSPTPAGIYPAEWDCGGSNFAASSCQAVAALEPPDAEASRSGDLVVWSTIGGLLLSVFVACLLASIREIGRIRELQDRTG